MQFMVIMWAHEKITKDWICIPASSSTEHELIDFGMCVSVLGCSRVDIMVDGADSVMPKNKLLIKGGGCALMREKVLIEAATRVFIMIDESKMDKDLRVPVEVLPMAALSLRSKFGGTIRADRIRYASDHRQWQYDY